MSREKECHYKQVYFYKKKENIRDEIPSPYRYENRFFSLCCRVFLIGSIFLTFRPETANAGGLFLPDLGAKAQGRGSAFVARADDGSAVYYNPAGLAKNREGLYLYATSTLGIMHLDYLRYGADVRDPYDHAGQSVPLCSIIDCDTAAMVALAGSKTVINPNFDYSQSNPLTDDPEVPVGPDAAKPYSRVGTKSPVSLSGMALVINWAWKLGEDMGINLAGGIFTPTVAGAAKYSETGPQRYQMVESNYLMASVALGLAFRLNRYFQLGAIFVDNIVKADQVSVLRDVARGSDDSYFNENITDDQIMKTELQDFFMPSAIAGVMSKPSDWLELGVSYRAPYKMEADGKNKILKQPEHFQPQIIPGNDSVKVVQNFPMAVSGGVRFIILDRADVEVDYVWENWSTVQSRVIENNVILDLDGEENGWLDPSDDTALHLPDIYQKKYFRDTHSIRLGGDVTVVDGLLDLRTGAFWESSHYPEDNRTFSLDNPYGTKLGVGGGCSFNIMDIVGIHLAYVHIFQQRVILYNGVIQQMIAQPVDPDDPAMREAIEQAGYDPDDVTQHSEGNIVNNGVYDVGFDLISLSLDAQF